MVDGWDRLECMTWGNSYQVRMSRPDAIGKSEVDGYSTRPMPVRLGGVFLLPCLGMVGVIARVPSSLQIACPWGGV